GGAHQGVAHRDLADGAHPAGTPGVGTLAGYLLRRLRRPARAPFPGHGPGIKRAARRRLTERCRSYFFCETAPSCVGWPLPPAPTGIFTDFGLVGCAFGTVRINRPFANWAFACSPTASSGRVTWRLTLPAKISRSQNCSGRASAGGLISPLIVICPPS